jgi:hypothetical protein
MYKKMMPGVRRGWLAGVPPRSTHPEFNGSTAAFQSDSSGERGRWSAPYLGSWPDPPLNLKKDSPVSHFAEVCWHITRKGYSNMLFPGCRVLGCFVQ